MKREKKGRGKKSKMDDLTAEDGTRQKRGGEIRLRRLGNRKKRRKERRRKKICC